MLSSLSRWFRSTAPPCAPLTETARLLLREMEYADWAAIHGYRSDPEVTRYLGNPSPDTEWDTRGVVRSCLRRRLEQPRRFYGLVIVRRTDGEVIGDCELSLDHADEALLGFVLRRDTWGQGYATETARAVLELAFTRLGRTRVRAGCHPENAGSRRVLEKIGMQPDGVAERFPGAPAGIPVPVFAITREQWEG